MNCATCNEHIDEYQDKTSCDICGRDMHVMCTVDRESPIEEYLRTFYPTRLRAAKTTYCFFCYEIESQMVRLAMIGEMLAVMPGSDRIPAIRDVTAKWRAKYTPILDAWPREPQARPEISDEEWVEQMVREIRKAG